MLTVSRSAEARLVETLNGIHDQKDSWIAVLFHLDKLLEEYQSEFQVKIAVNLINDLLEQYEGGIYAFADGSIGVLCNYLNPMLLSKLIFQLRYLYMDDPLAYSAEGQENPAFCTVYNLKNEWQPCLDASSKKMMMLARGAKAALTESAQGGFSAAKLAHVERELRELDISAALRRQPVCAIAANAAIRRVFDELYINISHLRTLLKADVDVLSNKWLFKYMTGLLDERVFDLIGKQSAQYLALPVSINVNSEALLSSWFTHFDALLKPAQKVSVVFEIPVVDVFADIQTFSYARELVQQKGYRVCIDGLNTQTLLHINREHLKADLLKLQWNADVTADLKNAQNKLLLEKVKQAGSGRIILCRCDTKASVEYGQIFGISLFQGRYLDGLLNPNATVQN